MGLRRPEEFKNSREKEIEYYKIKLESSLKYAGILSTAFLTFGILSFTYLTYLEGKPLDSILHAVIFLLVIIIIFSVILGFATINYIFILNRLKRLYKENDSSEKDRSNKNKNVQSPNYYSMLDEILTNPNFKKEVIENLRKSGIPLEIEACKIFQNRGFIASSFNWREEQEDGNFTYREIDAFARREVDLSTEHFTIKIEIDVFGSCKHRESYAYFLFEGQHPEAIQKFPVLSCLDFLKEGIPKTANELGFPVVVDHTVQGAKITIKPPKDPKEITVGKFSDRGIYNGANDSLAFTEHYYTSPIFRPEASIKGQCPSEFSTLLLSIASENKISLSDNKQLVINRAFTNKNVELLEILKRRRPFIKIHIGFPMVITEGKIFKVILDNEKEPKDIEDVGFGLYLHRPERNDKWSILERTPFIPTIITDINHLSDSIDVIENIVKESCERVNRMIKARNYEKLIKFMLEACLEM